MKSHLRLYAIVALGGIIAGVLFALGTDVVAWLRSVLGGR